MQQSIESIEGPATASNYSSPPHTIWNNIIFALMEMLEETFSFTKRMTRKLCWGWGGGGWGST